MLHASTCKDFLEILQSCEVIGEPLSQDEVKAATQIITAGLKTDRLPNWTLPERKFIGMKKKNRRGGGQN